MNEFKTFEELVTWAAWHVVEGITKGKPLRSLIGDVLSIAVRWGAEQQAVKASKGGADAK